ncbi:MAG: PrsW family intramembrane metalloprotease [Thermomicrobium sp.]|nr:PrsW family intramembrane metalloprotease [Thermomicrobium sp.]MDW8059683.1 PrsW family intramembrane metalloprotease [Thermomicrobium sp.]
MSQPTSGSRAIVWPLLTGCLALVSVTGACCMLAGYHPWSSPVGILVVSVLALAVVPVYLLYLLMLDPLEREPWWLLALAFLWGAGAATLVGALVRTVVESVVHAVSGLSPATYETIDSVLAAPLVEEACKGAFLLFLFLLARHEFDDAVDGIVYGGIVGLGFRVIEDLGYYVDEFEGGDPWAVALLFVTRGILTGFSHSFFTALTGLGFGLAVQARSPLLRWSLPPSGFAGAVAFHALHNGAAELVERVSSEVLGWLLVLALPALVYLPGAIGLALVAFVQGRRRQRDVRKYLAEAVDLGLADPADLTVLPDPWRRRRRVWATLFRYGLEAQVFRQALDRALVDWAFRRWHRERGERLPAYLAAFEVEALETRIRFLRAELARLERAATR